MQEQGEPTIITSRTPIVQSVLVECEEYRLRRKATNDGTDSVRRFSTEVRLTNLELY